MCMLKYLYYKTIALLSKIISSIIILKKLGAKRARDRNSRSTRSPRSNLKSVLLSSASGYLARKQASPSSSFSTTESSSVVGTTRRVSCPCTSFSCFALSPWQRVCAREHRRHGPGDEQRVHRRRAPNHLYLPLHYQANPMLILTSSPPSPLLDLRVRQALRDSLRQVRFSWRRPGLAGASSAPRSDR